MSKFQVGDTVRYKAIDIDAAKPDGLIGKIIDANKGEVLWEDGSTEKHSLQYLEVIASAPAIDAHYTKHAIEPMEYSMANKLDAMQHTVVKYVTRFRDKHGKRDLLAARHILDKLIAREYPNG